MSAPDGTCCKTGNKTNSARHCKNFEESRCPRPEVRHIKLPATEYKISAADFVTVDDVLEESTKSLADMIAEAYMKALKEDIKANTVIIDEHFAKVNAFDFVWVRDVMHLPPMICGLEIQVSDELPDGYDFAVLEVPETERDRLVRKAKAEAAVEIFEEIEKYMMDSVDVTHTAYKTIGTSTFAILKKKYTEVQK
jgi:predicted nucleic acid-binding protein